ncbi:hypothetical protein LHL03_07210 [Pectobacterium carotovorum]|uniref:hypothetical protein n=1 Tax=Pectobacterium carotovorum TaxID=554 RepID=UPI001CFAAF5E|nr:hypothetical protein [Pectobacterium carotovorum]UCZ80911.1 hypothetical protein LHL03_07210 [Pectobacterium carotovorum]
MDHRIGVMSPLDAAPKPPRSTAAHRRPLRATNPFETPFFAYFFFCPFRPSEKMGKRLQSGWSRHATGFWPET